MHQIAASVFKKTNKPKKKKKVSIKFRQEKFFQASRPASQRPAVYEFDEVWALLLI